jgi:hypothetical protein
MTSVRWGIALLGDLGIYFEVMKTHPTAPKRPNTPTATITAIAPGRHPPRPVSAIAVEEELAEMHASALRVRGVLHLLDEALQSGNGISPKHAAAVSALVNAAKKDLTLVDRSIDALLDAHLERSRR